MVRPFAYLIVALWVLGLLDWPLWFAALLVVTLLVTDRFRERVRHQRPSWPTRAGPLV